MKAKIADVIEITAEQLFLKDDGRYDHSVYSRDRHYENGHLRFSTDGVAFKFRVDGSFLGYLDTKEKPTALEERKVCSEYEERVYVTAVFLKPHCVFYTASESFSTKDLPKGDAFKNLSNHDSCWKGPLGHEVHVIACAMRDEIIAHIERELGEKASHYKIDVHPDMYVECHPGHHTSSNFITPVKAVLEKEEDGYHYKIISLEAK